MAGKPAVRRGQREISWRDGFLPIGVKQEASGVRSGHSGSAAAKCEFGKRENEGVVAEFVFCCPLRYKKSQDCIQFLFNSQKKLPILNLPDSQKSRCGQT